MENSLDLIVICLTFILAGAVKGMIGLGLPTVAVGMLGLVMAPMEAASLLIVPSLVTNVWQLMSGSGLRPLARRLWPMSVGICVGTWIGGALLGADSMKHATAALGIALIMYALVGLSPLWLSVSAKAERRFSPVIGAATGLVTAATGVFVIPAVPFLQALDLDKDDLVQAMGITFTVSTLALAVGLARGGTFHMAAMGTSLFALLPALAGMYLGQRLRKRISVRVFKMCFFLGLMGLGAHLALRGWS